MSYFKKIATTTFEADLPTTAPEGAPPAKKAKVDSSTQTERSPHDHPDGAICPVSLSPYGMGKTGPMILGCESKRENDPRCTISESSWETLKQSQDVKNAKTSIDDRYKCPCCRAPIDTRHTFKDASFTPPGATEPLDFSQDYGVTDEMDYNLKTGQTHPLDFICLARSLTPHPSLQYYISRCYTSLSQHLKAIQSTFTGLTQFNFFDSPPNDTPGVTDTRFHFPIYVYLTLDLLETIHTLQSQGKSLYHTHKIPDEKLALFVNNCFTHLPADPDVTGPLIYSNLIKLLYYACPHLDKSVCLAHATSLTIHLKEYAEFKQTLLTHDTLLKDRQSLYSGDDERAIFIQKLLRSLT